MINYKKLLPSKAKEYLMIREFDCIEGIDKHFAFDYIRNITQKAKHHE